MRRIDGPGEESVSEDPGPAEGPQVPSPLCPEQLGEFEILEGVSLGERRALLEAAEEHWRDAGETIIEAGQAPERMYLLAEGRLGVFLGYCDEEPVAEVHRGGAVGELGLLDGALTSANVRTLEGSRLLSLDEDAFWRLVSTSHGFAVNLLTTLASRLRANNSAICENVEKRRKFEKVAMFDGLTGIHNRRWLDSALERLVGRCQRSGHPLSVSLLDVDHFKRFNDHHGHDAGDEVLIAVAKALTENVRPTDLVARYGGEEFVVIFPETDAGSAQIAANRVRTAVEKLKLRMPDGRDLPPVTISMGVAQWCSELDPCGLLKEADAAMYTAKRSGRNRVCVATRSSSLHQAKNP